MTCLLEEVTLLLNVTPDSGVQSSNYLLLLLKQVVSINLFLREHEITSVKQVTISSFFFIRSTRTFCEVDHAKVLIFNQTLYNWPVRSLPERSRKDRRER